MPDPPTDDPRPDDRAAGAPGRSAEEWEAAIRATVRGQRLARGWSLKDAARRSGGRLKPSTLGAYERGDRRMSVTVLHQLAALYRVPVRSFIPREPTRRTTADQVVRAIERLPDRHRSLLAALADELRVIGVDIDAHLPE